MKNRFFQIVLGCCVLSSIFSKAQFNTLTPRLPNKEKMMVEEKPIPIQPEVSEKKKMIKTLFNVTTKSQLKNDIDSLKTLIKDYRNFNERKMSMLTQIQDSLINIVQKKQAENPSLSVSSNAFIEDESVHNLPRIVMPLKNKMKITSGFGNRIHPIFGIKKMHNGIDFQAHYENIYAVMDGVVSEAGWDSKGGGNYIKLKHFNRFETSYLHLSEAYYKAGEKVRAGFVIGKTGNSGNSTGPHLHFSVKEYRQNINPAHFLNDLTKANQLITVNYE
ncbi:M23 family metallopeptidase [Chryseobacterium sp.]|uniref:M23 family metallopeptidase n=1 Tax=Chryseobacterium sp. TaxID=1871047 RepID=UPI002FC84733